MLQTAAEWTCTLACRLEPLQGPLVACVQAQEAWAWATGPLTMCSLHVDPVQRQPRQRIFSTCSTAWARTVTGRIALEPWVHL